ncbi:unnamed protein product, partial [Ectocarpus sp. 8 AP-2014]
MRSRSSIFLHILPFFGFDFGGNGREGGYQAVCVFEYIPPVAVPTYVSQRSKHSSGAGSEPRAGIPGTSAPVMRNRCVQMNVRGNNQTVTLHVYASPPKSRVWPTRTLAQSSVHSQASACLYAEKHIAL